MVGPYLPWFKMFAAETLSDERFSGWTCEERGAWLTLILHAWREGSIPAEQHAIARLLHVDGRGMALLWSAIGDRFVQHPDHPNRLTSPRLEMEREEAKLSHAQKVSAGKLGAESRWGAIKRANSGAMAEPSQTNATALANDSDQIRPAQTTSAQVSQDGRLAGLDEGLMSVAKRLGAHFGRLGPLGVGKDWAKVSSSFSRWLKTVGEDFLVAECIRLAEEKGVTPFNLSWWPGWLDTVSDADLERAAK